MRLFHKSKPPYDTSEIADYIGFLGELTQKREKILMLSITTRSDAKQQIYLEEVDRYDDMIKASQLVYEFMVSEVAEYNKEMKQKQSKRAGK